MNMIVIFAINTVALNLHKDNIINKLAVLKINQKIVVNCWGAVTIERAVQDTKVSIDNTIFVKYVTRNTN